MTLAWASVLLSEAFYLNASRVGEESPVFAISTAGRCDAKRQREARDRTTRAGRPQ